MYPPLISLNAFYFDIELFFYKCMKNEKGGLASDFNLRMNNQVNLL